MVLEAVDAARIPYHSDGTVGRLFRNSPLNPSMGFSGPLYQPNGWQEMPPAALEALNSITGANMVLDSYTWDRAGNSNVVDGYKMQVIFAVPQDLRAIMPVITSGFIRTTSPVGPYLPRVLPVLVEYSTDTLSGDDGTWKTLATTPQFVYPLRPYRRTSRMSVEPTIPRPLEWKGEYYRGSVGDSGSNDEGDFYTLTSRLYSSFTVGGATAVDVEKVRGLRLTTQTPTNPPGYGSTAALGFSLSLFLWGRPSEGFYDYLQVEDTTFNEELDQEAAIGDVPYHSSGDRKIRVRNRSFKHTASRVVVSAGTESGLPNFYRGMFLFSLDGVRWDEHVTLYSMTPGAVSPTIYVRRVTGAEFPSGIGQVLLSAKAGRWG